METGGLMNYQTMNQQPTGPVSTSTKVLNLSRAQINLGQPSPPQQTYYAQPAQSTMSNYSPQVSPAMATAYQQPQGSPQGYQTMQRVGSPGQPQVFTVGSSALNQPTGQQFRVITQPQQQQQQQFTGTDAYAMNQPASYSAVQPNVIYFGQPQPGTIQNQQYDQQYGRIPAAATTNQPQQQQYYQHPQQQQQQIQQSFSQASQQPIRTDYQQQGQQVYFAQPATAQSQPRLQQQQQQPYQAPPPTMFQGQSSGMPGSVIVPANQQQSAAGPRQPIQIQSSQQWITPAAVEQAQQPPRQFASPGQAPTSPQFASSAYSVGQQAPQTTVYNTPQQYTNQPRAVAPTEIVYQSQGSVQHQSRPPLPADGDTTRRRVPSSSGATRAIKVRSLPMRGSASVDALDKAVGPPQFVQQPAGQLTVNEGEPVTVNACVRPAGDSTLSVEWFKNGKPLSASSRFSTIFDRGHAVLEFIYTNEDDSGDYSCVATNSCGQDQSTGCRITVIPEESVVTDTQLPEESMVANLAAMESQMMQNGLARTTRYRDEPRSTQPPQFVKPLAPQVGLRESAPARFETIVEPGNDASLTVEWYKDGKPVSMGCRFNAVLDRGFAVLDILYCYPEDNGAYCCVAKNAAGQVQSNVVELQCSAEASIVTNSVLSKESVSYLQSLDNWNSEQMAGYDRPALTEEEEPSAPAFDVFPQPLTVTEGSPAKFMVKASGFPRPIVQWFIDGDLLASQGGGGNWRVYQDGGISHLEFHRVGSPCQQQVRAVARNNLGEVSAETVLTIEPQLDFRPDLRHVQLENPFKKLAQLKKVERTSELAHAFSRPKPQALDLRRLERQSEQKARNTADAEVIETENLYSRVQSQLRTNRRTSLPPPSPAAPRQQPAAPQMDNRAPNQPMPQTMQQQYAPPKPPPTQAPIQQQQPPPQPQPVVKQQQPQPQPVVQQQPPPPPAQPIAPPPPPPPAAQPIAPPPPPPPPAQPIAPPPPPPTQILTNQVVYSPPQQAQIEYAHDEVSADFTIEL